MYVPRAMYSLRMSFWMVPRSCAGADALLLADRDVEREQGRRGRVDRHRRRDLGERDAVEEDAHVVERVDRDADPADLALRHRVIGVAAHLGRQIERDRQALAALREQELVAAVGLGGGAEAGVLAHRPQLAAVHRRLHAARVRELAGRAQLVDGERRVVGAVRALDLDVGVGREALLPELGHGRTLARPRVEPTSIGAVARPRSGGDRATAGAASRRWRAQARPPAPARSTGRPGAR